MKRRGPYGLYVEMLSRGHLGHRVVALIGQVLAVDAELSWLLGLNKQFGLLRGDALGRFIAGNTFDVGGVHESWSQFMDAAGAVGGGRPRDPELLAELQAALEAALVGGQATLARLREVLGVTGSSFDFLPSKD